MAAARSVGQIELPVTLKSEVKRVGVSSVARHLLAVHGFPHSPRRIRLMEERLKEHCSGTITSVCFA